LEGVGSKGICKRGVFNQGAGDCGNLIPIFWDEDNRLRTAVQLHMPFAGAAQRNFFSAVLADCATIIQVCWMFAWRKRVTTRVLLFLHCATLFACLLRSLWNLISYWLRNPEFEFGFVLDWKWREFPSIDRSKISIYLG